MNLIWATRGRTWGFRFLLSGGHTDPLPAYDEAFAGFEDEPEVCRRIGDKVALRFPDPQKREDYSGRVIPHDFVVFGKLIDQLDSVEDGIEHVWPLVRDQFARDWGGSAPHQAGE